MTTITKEGLNVVLAESTCHNCKKIFDSSIHVCPCKRNICQACFSESTCKICDTPWSDTRNFSLERILDHLKTLTCPLCKDIHQLPSLYKCSQGHTICKNCKSDCTQCLISQNPRNEENYSLICGSTIIEELTCAICKYLLKPPLYMCTVGHVICSECKPKLPNCTTCKNDWTLTRNFLLENLVQNMKFRCKYGNIGCLLIASIEHIEKHEEICQFQIFDCPFVDQNINCDWSGFYSEIFKHVKDVHAINYLTNGEVKTIPFNMLNNINSNYFIEYDDNLFKIDIKNDVINSSTNFSVQHIILTNCLKPSYKFDLKITNNLNPANPFSVKRFCHSSIKISNKMEKISHQELASYINNNEIRLSINLEKCSELDYTATSSQDSNYNTRSVEDLVERMSILFPAYENENTSSEEDIQALESDFNSWSNENSEERFGIVLNSPYYENENTSNDEDIAALDSDDDYNPRSIENSEEEFGDSHNSTDYENEDTLSDEDIQALDSDYNLRSIENPEEFRNCSDYENENTSGGEDIEELDSENSEEYIGEFHNYTDYEHETSDEDIQASDSDYNLRSIENSEEFRNCSDYENENTSGGEDIEELDSDYDSRSIENSEEYIGEFHNYTDYEHETSDEDIQASENDYNPSSVEEWFGDYEYASDYENENFSIDEDIQEFNISFGSE